MWRAKFQLTLDVILRLITKLRKNVRKVLMPFADHLFLRKRARIETVIDQLKNVCETLALWSPQPH